MKTSQVILASIMTVLLLFGCSKAERETEAVPKKRAAVEQPAGQTSETAQSDGAAGEAVPETTEQIAGTAEEVATPAVSDEAVEETAASETSASEEPAGSVDHGEVEVVETPEASATEASSSGADASINVPEVVILKNSKGNITMPHKKHSTTFACQKCHGDAIPGPIELNMEKCHALCQGCHKEMGAGPTSCNGCHEKKPKKAIQGC